MLCTWLNMHTGGGGTNAGSAFDPFAELVSKHSGTMHVATRPTTGASKRWSSSSSSIHPPLTHHAAEGSRGGGPEAPEEHAWEHQLHLPAHHLGHHCTIVSQEGGSQAPQPALEAAVAAATGTTGVRASSTQSSLSDPFADFFSGGVDDPLGASTGTSAQGAATEGVLSEQHQHQQQQRQQQHQGDFLGDAELFMAASSSSARQNTEVCYGWAI